MAQPRSVPADPSRLRSYSSPPRRLGSWRAERPGENIGESETAEAGFGNQGPDQGYLLKLADLLDDEIVLGPGEHRDDVIAGAATVALKRASLFGRGPVIHDLRVALGIWGFLDPEPPGDLVDARRTMFAEVAHPHHYAERRAIADAVPAEVLHQPHGAIETDRAADWRAVVRLPDAS